MSSAALTQPPAAAVGSDIASLLSHFGQSADALQYQEVARQEQADQAARRWPLLAAMQGLGGAAPDGASP
jgi:hypothetical protein